MISVEFGENNPDLLEENFVRPLVDWADEYDALEVVSVSPEPWEAADVVLFTFSGIHKNKPLKNVCFMTDGTCLDRQGGGKEEKLSSWKEGAAILLHAVV